MTLQIDLEPTFELGYLTGLVFGDGFIQAKKSHNFVIGLKTTDPELASVFQKTSREVGLNPCFYTQHQKRTKWGKLYDQVVLCTETNSKLLYNFLRSHKLPDYRWTYPSELDSKDFRRGFLQGMFDAEGSVVYGYCHAKGRKSLKRYISVSAASKYMENLSKIQELLASFEVHSRVYNLQFYSDLRIFRREDILCFRDEIGFNLKRKQSKLQRGIEFMQNSNPYPNGWGVVRYRLNV